jgi:hypothetical protein
MAWWWNVPVKPGDTPLEFLDRFFLTTGIDPGISDSIHQPESSASSLKQIILEAFYAPRPPDPEIQLAGKQIWDETHLRLWWMGLAKRLQLLFIRGRSRHSTTDRTNP